MKKWIPVWTLPFLAGLAVLSVWLRLTIVRTTYEIDQMSKMVRNTQQDMERLELKVAKLRSPRHLETIARQRLGLAPPSADQVIRLSE